MYHKFIRLVSYSSINTMHQPSSIPYGTLLSTKVAQNLLAQRPILYNHRDYCGMGLAYDKDNNKYAYGSVYDGCLMSVEKSFDK